MPPRPPWYRTARNIGGAPWVPFQVANALQEQLDSHAQRLQWAQSALNQSQRDLRAASQRLGAVQSESRRGPSEVEPLVRRIAALEQALVDARGRLETAIQEAERAHAEADAAREQARALADALVADRDAERAAEREDPESEGSRVAALKADLANVRRHVSEEIARGVRGERVTRLQALLDVHDDLLRSLHSQTDITSPWYQGHSAILKRVQAELKRAGASPVGKVGEPFDPRRHEAVASAPSDKRADTVIAVEQVGYSLDDGTLVRPARVVVSAG